MKKYCYFNGRIVDSKRVGLVINDIGIIRGYAIFDYLRTYNGKPFRLYDYYKRFSNTANSTGFGKLPISQKQLDEILRKLLKKNKIKDSSFRLVMTGGASPNNMSLDRKPNFYIIVEKFPKIDPKWFENGAYLITDEYQRAIPESKTCNYVRAVKMQPTLRKAQAKEILYYYKGKVLECATSNIFIVKKNRISTPQHDILYGVTRKVVLELARKLARQNNWKVEERDVKVNELFGADEVFITSSGKARMLPIVKIDGKKIGNGKVGSVTKELMDSFKDYTRNW